MKLEQFKWCTQTQGGGGTMTTSNNDRKSHLVMVTRRLLQEGLTRYAGSFPLSMLARITETLLTSKLEQFKWCTQTQGGGGTMTTSNNDRKSHLVMVTRRLLQEGLTRYAGSFPLSMLARITETLLTS
ncbi:UNVERIFIED_ASMBLY: minor tail protein [Shigella phage 2019SD1]|uniref:Minor tail protein n=1 Tax=Shigella phage 2019SD1 TaxID=2848074 RepID=A0A6M5CAS7_9CAUD|nr:minor tail protein [Shigella phage 2019SD1]